MVCPLQPWRSRAAQRLGAVIGVVIALLMGGTLLMGTLAFGGQMFFEYQAHQGER